MSRQPAKCIGWLATILTGEPDTAEADDHIRGQPEPQESHPAVNEVMNDVACHTAG